MPSLNELERRARATALGDVYVMTNQILDLLESRLAAIQQALAARATIKEVVEAMGGTASLWP